MKGPIPFHDKIITKKRNYIDDNKKSSPEPLGQFQPNFAQCILVQMKGPTFFEGEIITK